MEYLEKPPIEKKWCIIKFIIILLLIICSLLLTRSSLKSVAQYEQASKNPLKLQALITHVEVEIDTENGDDYYAMMEYVYNGVKYVKKYEKFVSEKKAEALIGKQVTISVDPEKPGDLISDIKGSGRMKPLLGSILLMVAAFLWRLPHRKSYIETYGWHREAIKKDIYHWLHHSLSFELIIMAIYYFAVVCMRPEFYLQATLFNLLVIAAAVVGLVRLVREQAALKKVKSDEFVLRRDVFVSKSVSSFDDSDTYKVTYGNEDVRWTTTVSRKVYDQAVEGNVVESVYLEGETKRIMSYTSSGEII